jgi:hypothetical protein
MRHATKKLLAALALPFVLAIAGCESGDDDDTVGDDDSATGDDDSSATDDDDSAGDDDDTVGDDDNMTDYGVRTDDGSAPRHPGFLRGLRLA